MCLRIIVHAFTVHDVTWYARKFDKLLRRKSFHELPAQVIRTMWTMDPAGSVPLDNL